MTEDITTVITEPPDASLCCAGVDGARTEKGRSALLIVVCQALVELGVMHTSSPSFPFSHKRDA